MSSCKSFLRFVVAITSQTTALIKYRFLGLDIRITTFALIFGCVPCISISESEPAFVARNIPTESIWSHRIVCKGRSRSIVAILSQSFSPGDFPAVNEVVGSFEARTGRLNVVQGRLYGGQWHCPPRLKSMLRGAVNGDRGFPNSNDSYHVNGDAVKEEYDPKLYEALMLRERWADDIAQRFKTEPTSGEIGVSHELLALEMISIKSNDI